MCSRTRCASHNTHLNLKFGYEEPYKVEVYKNEWVRNVGEFLFKSADGVTFIVQKVFIF